MGRTESKIKVKNSELTWIFHRSHGILLKLINCEIEFIAKTHGSSSKISRLDFEVSCIQKEFASGQLMMRDLSKTWRSFYCELVRMAAATNIPAGDLRE
jgi:hypothetical protein